MKLHRPGPKTRKTYPRNKTGNRPSRGPGPSLDSILVATDLSPESAKALKYAVALAGRTAAQITLLHVIEPVGPELHPFPMAVDENLSVHEAQVAMRIFCKRENFPLPAIRTMVRIGTPWHEIVEAALELKSQLLVVATHGRTGLQHLLLGSTAEKVVRHAPCPVLAVRETEREFIQS
jgi:universal stress protein A